VSDEWQSETRFQNLAICGKESAEERDETDHHDPVGDTRGGEVEHFGVPEDLFQHVRKPGAAIVLSGWVGLSFAEDGQELFPVYEEQNHGGDGDPVRDRRKYQVQPVGHSEEGICEERAIREPV
jgi:hypothetical protein